MVEAKTVDNLGPEVHQRFINDVKLLNEEEVQKFFQSPSVAKRAEILKTSPKHAETDILWGLSDIGTSLFNEPPDFVLSTDIFTYKIIPSLEEKDVMEKLNLIKKEEGTDVEQQRQNLLKFAAHLDNLNKILAEIQRKKDEYHKG